MLKPSADRARTNLVTPLNAVAEPRPLAPAPSSVRFPFPAGFKWGAACAAFQVEGGADAERRGPSVWDAVSARESNRFYQGHTPAVAADFYHRYAEDVAMMRELGLKSFRFSISWSRVMPRGRGAVNPKGIAFYNRLIDLLLDNGIEPLVDPYHWDLPQALAEEGGFTRARIIDESEAYATLCYRSFSDRVKLWSTLNEPSALEHFNPFCSANSNRRARFKIDRHILLMHYAAVRAFRRHDRGHGQIGAVIAYVPIYPRSMDREDRLAAER